MTNTPYCNFCGKLQYEVGKLIVGPHVFICNECIELCMDIISDDGKKVDGEAEYASWVTNPTTGTMELKVDGEAEYASWANHQTTGTMKHKLHAMVEDLINKTETISNEWLPLLRAQTAIIEEMRQALENINSRASPTPDRTFDDCINDLYWCASESRRILY